MSIINRTDLIEKVRALFGIITGFFGGTMSDEIVGVVILEDVSGPDQVSTQHPLRAIGSSSSAAGGVGFFSKVGLQNPVGSGKDLFLEKIIVQVSGNGDRVTIRRGVIAASPNAGIRSWKDGRVIGSPVGIMWDENATVTLGTAIQRISMLASTPFRLELGLTLEPGQSVHVQADVANEALTNQTLHWVERIRRDAG